MTTVKEIITNGSLPEFAGQIVDLFEDSLYNAGIKFERRAPDEEDNNETLFYGEYYDMVADPVRSQMEEIIEQDFDFVNAQKVRNAALEGLKETVKWAGTNKALGNVFYCEMDRKLTDLFSDWKLI